jgi:site-specific recombinase XerD
VEDVLGAFADAQRRRGLRETSILKRDSDLTAYLRHFGDPFTVDHDELDAWLDSRPGRNGHGLSARTRCSWLSNLHEFYRWAIRAGHTEYDPTERIDRPKTHPGLPRPIDSDDLAMALSATDDAQMLAWLHTMAYAGLRCSEVAWLTRDRVIDREGLIVVLGKGGKERVVPMHPLVGESLTRYRMPRTGNVFLMPDGAAWRAGRVSAKTCTYLHRLGIDATAHQLRHWFGTTTYAACQDIRVVQELMGHSSPVTTAGYAAWSRLVAREAVEALPVLKAA